MNDSMFTAAFGDYRDTRPFVTGAKAETQQRDWNALSAAIRGWADNQEIERLWDKCERWRVTIPTASQDAQVIGEKVATMVGHDIDKAKVFMEVVLRNIEICCGKEHA